MCIMATFDFCRWATCFETYVSLWLTCKSAHPYCWLLGLIPSQSIESHLVWFVGEWRTEKMKRGKWPSENLGVDKRPPSLHHFSRLLISKMCYLPKAAHYMCGVAMSYCSCIYTLNFGVITFSLGLRTLHSKRVQERGRGNQHVE